MNEVGLPAAAVIFVEDDLVLVREGTDTDEEEDCPPCEIEVTPCDGDNEDILLAMGLGCADRPVIQGSSYGHPDSQAVLTTLRPWSPREGSRFAVLGTGRVSEFTNPAVDCAFTSTMGGQFDQGTTLPSPIQTHDAGGLDCTEDPDLVGFGDCSNTISSQFGRGGSAQDYSELRATLLVPEHAKSIKFDFAFFTSEYPEYVGSSFNDMFIGWLDSEDWTGNISFDNAGRPISVSASFLDYRDDDHNLSELASTCMTGHGASSWLTSTAPVRSGEEVTIVFAIFDMGDALYDSFVLLDNFRWGCDACGGPTTLVEDDA